MGGKDLFEALFITLGSLFLPLQTYLPDVVGNSYQIYFSLHLCKPPEVEATEAHIVFNVPKATFDLNTSLLF